jgi:hypothetical protein
MTNRKLMLVTVLATFPLGLAVAQGADPNGQPGMQRSNAAFEKLDKNHDGRISQSEASADSTITWSSADVNGDGFLDSREWTASRGGAEQSSRPGNGGVPSTPSDPATQTPPPPGNPGNPGNTPPPGEPRSPQ